MKKEQFPTIQHLFKTLFGKDEENEYIYDYLSLMLKKPYEKKPYLFIVSDIPAVGKTTFIRIVESLLNGDLKFLDQHQFLSDFNSSYADSTCVAIEEALFTNSEVFEKLKFLSTCVLLTVNKKLRNPIQIKPKLHFIITSNGNSKRHRKYQSDRRRVTYVIKNKPTEIDSFDNRIFYEMDQFKTFIMTREISRTSDQLFKS